MSQQNVEIVKRIKEKIGHLSEERKRRLEAVRGWGWGRHDAAWEDGYAHLLRFAKREGRSRVPRSYRDDDGFSLGQWVNNQRAHGRRGQLSEERARRLEVAPGWVWQMGKSGTHYPAPNLPGPAPNRPRRS